MTLEEALLTDAVALLLRLEAEGFDLAVVTGGLRVKPVGRLSADLRAAIAAHREALLVLVRHCCELASSREVA